MKAIIKVKNSVLLLTVIFSMYGYGPCDFISNDGSGTNTYPTIGNSFTWAKLYEIGSTGELQSIQPTKDGGAIVLLLSITGNYILKLDANGAIQWQKKEAGNSMIDVFETKSGDFIIGCRDENGGIYVIKIDKNGAGIWKKSYNYNGLFELVGDEHDDSVLIAGTIYFSPDATVSLRIPLIKISANGDLLWDTSIFTKTYELMSVNTKGSVINAADGGYYIAIVDFQSFGGPVYGIIRIDRNGTLQWSKQFTSAGGSLNEEYFTRLDAFESIAPTSDGGIAIAGTTGQRKGTDQQGYRNMTWIMKLDISGTLQMAEEFKNLVAPATPSTWLVLQQGWDHPYSLSQVTDGGYAVLISSYTEVKYSPFTDYSIDYQKNAAALIKLNANGTIEWQKRYRDPSKTVWGYDVPTVGDEGERYGGLYTLTINSINVSSIREFLDGGYMVSASVSKNPVVKNDIALAMKTDTNGNIGKTKLKIDNLSTTVGNIDFKSESLNFTPENLSVAVTNGEPSLTDAAVSVTDY